MIIVITWCITKSVIVTSAFGTHEMYNLSIALYTHKVTGSGITRVMRCILTNHSKNKEFISLTFAQTGNISSLLSVLASILSHL